MCVYKAFIRVAVDKGAQLEKNSVRKIRAFSHGRYTDCCFLFVLPDVNFDIRSAF